jgi:hypothetical protein
MCSRHTDLLRFYERAITTYETTTQALEAAQETHTTPEYKRVGRFVEQAHAKANQARNELDKHRAEAWLLFFDALSQGLVFNGFRTDCFPKQC